MKKKSTEAMPGCGDAGGECPECMCPTTCHLFQVSWSIMWRYLVIGAVFMGIMYTFYSFQVGFVMGFMGYVHEFREAALAGGFGAALMLHPFGTFFWFVFRFFLGYLITWWIFCMIVGKNYCHFTLHMMTPTPSATCKISHCKATQRVSWAFYWRFYILIMLVFLASLNFIKPEVMFEHLFCYWLFFMFLAFITIPAVLRHMINRPLGCRCGYKFCPCDRCKAMSCEKECKEAEAADTANAENCKEVCYLGKCRGNYGLYFKKM